MAEINTGGTAFPMQDPQAIHAYAAASIQGIADNEDRDRIYMEARAKAVGGMTLRDYFAAKAMNGLIAASGDDEGTSDYDEEIVARNAYAMADAMLKARG